MRLTNLIITLYFSFILITGCSNNNSEQHHDEHSKAEHSDMIKLSSASINEIGLKTEIVKLRNFTGYISLPAKVKVNQDKEAQVGSLTQGRVYKVFVKPGDYVRAGQVLMQVEGLEIGEIKAGYLKAKANLNFQKSNYERQRTLIEQNVGSKKSLLEAQSEYEKAVAEFSAEDKKIHSIGLNDEDITGNNNHDEEHTSGTLPVKSPISGIVAERNVVIGQFVDAATNAFRIIELSSVWIDGQIYEKDIIKISGNNNAVFTSASLPDQKFSGRINYIGQTVDEQSRTITVRAEFDNRNSRLKPEMFGDMLIQVNSSSKAILIPSESIVKIDNKDYVFVQQDETTFIKRAVVTGPVQEELIVIEHGLKENEKVVTKGSFLMKSELMKDEIEEHEH